MGPAQAAPRLRYHLVRCARSGQLCGARIALEELATSQPKADTREYLCCA